MREPAHAAQGGGLAAGKDHPVAGVATHHAQTHPGHQAQGFRIGHVAAAAVGFDPVVAIAAGAARRHLHPQAFPILLPAGQRIHAQAVVGGPRKPVLLRRADHDRVEGADAVALGLAHHVGIFARIHQAHAGHRAGLRSGTHGLACSTAQPSARRQRGHVAAGGHVGAIGLEGEHRTAAVFRPQRQGAVIGLVHIAQRTCVDAIRAWRRALLRGGAGHRAERECDRQQPSDHDGCVLRVIGRDHARGG